MRKKIFLCIIIVAVFFETKAQLSDSAHISVITCGSGDELYAVFGHSAIRIYDPMQEIDFIFNYGTFNFNTPHFYAKFSQGRLPYYLSLSPFSAFMNSYKREGRWVCEQPLNLTLEQKDILCSLLTENYLPENRFYAYDFFMDNCATRVRDMIESALKENNLFDTTFAENNLSFRQLIYPYMENMQWWRLGIDIALGMRCDKKASKSQYTFLPIELMNQIDTIKISSSKDKKLAIDKVMLLNETKSEIPASISPDLIFWLLWILILALTIVEFRTKKYFKAIDIVLFSLITILSILVIYLWFFSNHYTTKYNWNLLWANPLFLYLLIRLRKSNKIIIYSAIFCVGFNLIFFWFLPQTFNSAIFPILLILLTRLSGFVPLKRLSFKK